MKKWLIILSVIGFCLGFGVTQYFNSCAYLNKKADKLFLQDEFEKAVSLYQKAVDRGDGYACYRLGRLYQRGIGVDSVDKEKAISLFKTGSERGCIEAKVCVALYYLAGGDAKVNKEKGAEILNHLFETTDNVFVLKSATTRLYDTEAKIICIVSKKGAQCIECHHKDI